MRRMARAPVQQPADESDCSMASCSSSLDASRGSEIEEIRVLAVDDNKIDRKLIEMLLKTSSCNVTAVDSAERALDVLGLSGKGSPQRGKGSEFDLIITDYCMPQMTGYDLLTRVKDNSSLWKEIPVVVMSSENMPRRIRRCLDEGASEFLIKPVQLKDVERLRCQVREAKESRDEFSSPMSAKRKGSSSAGRQGRSVERRTRRELTVV